MASEQHRFPQRKRWGGCLSSFSCFKSQKGCKRIVPASRIPENINLSASQPNNRPHQAPPSSPASFINSPLPSTAQSPSYLSLSANSPGGPSSSMYATGPYANETQLVSPPVFSTYTTEPSTAPFTPPPEHAHLTTPSSPDVPYARFLTSNNFFCPETFAKFYLDNDPSVALNGGRLSVSKDSDVYPRPKQDIKEELDEAYRASFGFSADEIVTTSHYVEMTDVMDESLVVRNGIHADEEVLLSRVGSVKGNRRCPSVCSSSDAEVEYRRGRSLREGRGNRERIV